MKRSYKRSLRAAGVRSMAGTGNKNGRLRPHGSSRKPNFSKGLGRPKIVIKLDFLKPFEAPQHGRIHNTAAGRDQLLSPGRCTVPAPFMSKVMQVFMSMDKHGSARISKPVLPT